MGEYRRRTPKKPEHPVREWISDNLRYFMLIGILLAIVLVVFLIVKLLTGGFGGKSPVKAESKTESTQTLVPEEKEPVTEVAESEVTPEPGTVVVPEIEEEPEEEVFTEEVDNSMLTNLIKTYFEGLSTRNPSMVESVADHFSEADAEQVSNNTRITSYSDVEVCTCDGTDNKSRIAFVSYHYTVDGSDVKIPSLTEFYIYDTGSGRWKLASDITAVPDVEERVKSLMNDEKVTEMIDKVQKEYDQVLSEHPELQSALQ